MVSGMTIEEVLVYTRLAADQVGATPMDRCEDVEPDLATGKVYVACTNNSDRGVKAGKPGPDAPNPRGPNKNGHIIELSEQGNRADATSFTWNIFMLCGDTTDTNTYFAGWTGPVAPISCPDNLAFDGRGTCGSRPTAHRATSARPTACSGCRWPVRSAGMSCSSSPCRTRPRPAAR